MTYQHAVVCSNAEASQPVGGQTICLDSFFPFNFGSLSSMTPSAMLATEVLAGHFTNVDPRWNSPDSSSAFNGSLFRGTDLPREDNNGEFVDCDLGSQILFARFGNISAGHRT